MQFKGKSDAPSEVGDGTLKTKSQRHDNELDSLTELPCHQETDWCTIGGRCLEMIHIISDSSWNVPEME